jgi:hypothetical protein
MGSIQDKEPSQIVNSDVIINAIINSKKLKYSYVKNMYYRYYWTKHHAVLDIQCKHIDYTFNSHIQYLSKIGNFEGSLYGFIISSHNFPFVLIKCNTPWYRRIIKAIKQYFEQNMSRFCLRIIEDKRWKVNWVYNVIDL